MKNEELIEKIDEFVSEHFKRGTNVDGATISALSQLLIARHTLCSEKAKQDFLNSLDLDEMKVEIIGEQGCLTDRRDNREKR